MEFGEDSLPSYHTPSGRRRCRISAGLLQDMLTDDFLAHWQVTNGIPQGARLVNTELDEGRGFWGTDTVWIVLTFEHDSWEVDLDIDGKPQYIDPELKSLR